MTRMIPMPGEQIMEYIDCTPEFSRRNRISLSVEQVLAMGAIPIKHQHLLDPEIYTLTPRLTNAITEGEM